MLIADHRVFKSKTEVSDHFRDFVLIRSARIGEKQESGYERQRNDNRPIRDDAHFDLCNRIVLDPAVANTEEQPIRLPGKVQLFVRIERQWFTVDSKFEKRRGPEVFRTELNWRTWSDWCPFGQKNHSVKRFDAIARGVRGIPYEISGQTTPHPPRCKRAGQYQGHHANFPSKRFEEGHFQAPSEVHGSRD